MWVFGSLTANQLLQHEYLWLITNHSNVFEYQFSRNQAINSSLLWESNPGRISNAEISEVLGVHEKENILILPWLKWVFLWQHHLRTQKSQKHEVKMTGSKNNRTWRAIRLLSNFVLHAARAKWSKYWPRASAKWEKLLGKNWFLVGSCPFSDNKKHYAASKYEVKLQWELREAQISRAWLKCLKSFYFLQFLFQRLEQEGCYFK